VVVAADAAMADSFLQTTEVADAILSLSFFFSPAVVAATVSAASKLIEVNEKTAAASAAVIHT